MASPEVPFVDGMDFTVGVDTATGSARNAAATGAPTTVPQAGGSIVSFHMEQVETVEDLLTSLGVSAKASGGIGLFSASLRFDFAQSCQVHTSSAFLVVSVKVTEAFQSIRNPDIDPRAAQLLAEGRVDRFREQFGDVFVRGIKSGGQFFGVIEVLTHDQTDRQDVSIGLTASYAAFSASGTFDQKFTDTVKNHRTKVTCHVEGGQDLELPTAIDTMTKRAVNFPHELAGHAIPYLALLNDYGVLPLPEGPNFVDLQHQKDVLIECARLRNLHQTWLNDIDYISAHPTEFIDPDNAQLNALHSDILADLDIIAKAASLALDKPKDASNPVGLRVTLPYLPERVGSSTGDMVRVPDWHSYLEMEGVDRRPGIWAAAWGGLAVHHMRFTSEVDSFSVSPPPGTLVARGSLVTATYSVKMGVSLDFPDEDPAGNYVDANGTIIWHNPNAATNKAAWRNYH